VRINILELVIILALAAGLYIAVNMAAGFFSPPAPPPPALSAECEPITVDDRRLAWCTLPDGAQCLVGDDVSCYWPGGER
jgi:hypothetical protein